MASQTDRDPNRLILGYMGSPGLSDSLSNPDRPEGLSVALMSRVAAGLGFESANLRPVRCSWSDFIDRLTSQEVDVVIDPIMRTPARRQIATVPYVRIRCFRFICHRRILHHVRAGIRRTADALTQGNIQEFLQRLCRIPPDGSGFAVGENMFEDETLHNIPAEFESPVAIEHSHFSFNGDMSTPIIAALNENKVVLTDGVFARATIDRLEEQGIHHFEVGDLLEGWPGGVAMRFSPQVAGIAVRYGTDIAEQLARINLAAIFDKVCVERRVDIDDMGILPLGDVVPLSHATPHLPIVALKEWFGEEPSRPLSLPEAQVVALRSGGTPRRDMTGCEQAIEGSSRAHWLWVGTSLLGSAALIFAFAGGVFCTYAVAPADLVGSMTNMTAPAAALAVGLAAECICAIKWLRGVADGRKR